MENKNFPKKKNQLSDLALAAPPGARYRCSCMLDNAGTPSWRALPLLVDVGLRKPKKEKRMTRNPKIETFGDCRRSFAGWPPGARYVENPLSSRRVQTVLFFYLFSSSVQVGQFHCICLLASRGGNSGGGETGSGPSWQHK